MVKSLIKESIGRGATLEEAKASALSGLNAPEGTDVKYEVVTQGKAKLLGLFGGSDYEVRASYEFEDDKFAGAKEYINTMLVSLGVNDASIDVRVENGEDVRIEINCNDDYGSVIGRRGETLDAIQYLARLYISRNNEDYKHVSINIGNYREKREATLRALAKKNAAKVRKYGRNVVLEPMNPYERRIIHTTIQEVEGVTSHSVGSEDDRKVVITLEDGVKPTNGGGNYGGGNYGGRGRGGYNKGGYNKNRGRGNGGRQSEKPAAPSREPRSDTAGTLYGKIEVNKE